MIAALLTQIRVDMGIKGRIARRLWACGAGGAVLVLLTGCTAGEGDDVELDLFAHDRESADALPSALQVDGVVSSSTRLLGEVNDVRVWAARAKPNEVCLLLEQGPVVRCTPTGAFNDEGLEMEARAGNEDLLLKMLPDNYGVLADGVWNVIGSNLYVQRR